MYDKLLPLKEAIVDGLSGPAQRFHERQFDFFKKITAVSGQIKDFPKGPLRKNACSKALQVHIHVHRESKKLEIRFRFVWYSSIHGFIIWAKPG